MGKRKIDKYIMLVCFISTISQIPLIYSNGVLSSMTSLSWVWLAGILLYKNRFSISVRWILIFPIIFDIYCLIGEVVTDNKYIAANLFKPINMCTFLYIVGLLASQYFDFESLLNFAKAYIWGTTITSVVVYFQYCFGHSVAANSYLYNGKNSLASIVLVAMILAIMLRKWMFKTKFGKIILVLLTTFNVYFIFVLKSRTTLVCMLILFAGFIFIKDTKFSLKLFIIGITTILVLFICANAELYDTVVNVILLNGKDATDLNAITSNRMDHVEIFKELFFQHEVWGVGKYYLESFPLTVLLTFGILGAIPIFAFALSPLLGGIKGLWLKNKNRIFSLILIAISISLIVNGIAEEQPPFGPGVKCFAMWFLYGVYSGKLKNIRNREKVDV